MDKFKTARLYENNLDVEKRKDMEYIILQKKLSNI